MAPLVSAGPTLEPAIELDVSAIDFANGRRLRVAEAAKDGLNRGWLMRRMLLLADLLGLNLAFFTASFFGETHAGDRVAPGTEHAVFALSLPIWVLMAKLHGLYDRDEEHANHSTVDELTGVTALVSIGTWLVFAVLSLVAKATPDVGRLVAFSIIAVISIASFRAVARSFCRRRRGYVENTLIAGAGEVGQLIARKLLKHPEYGIRLIGFVDARPKERHPDLHDLTIVGTPDQLPRLVEDYRIRRVIIAFSNESDEESLNVIRALKDADVQIDLVPRFFEVIGSRVGMHTLEGVPLLGLPPLHLSRSSKLLKRIFDIGVASLALVLLSPVLILVALAIKLDSPGPVFFRQERVGWRDERFRIFKFRTMYADAERRKSEVSHLNLHAREGGDSRMFKVKDDPRVTRLGGVLRRFAIDELPQLVNVIRGDMSMVGPRPLIIDEDQWVSEWARKRLALKPGMTGLWQVLGASSIPFGEMTKLDYIYVTNWSLSGDFRLMLKTIPTILGKRVAY